MKKRNINVGDLVVALEKENIGAAHYTKPGYGFVVDIDHGSWLEDRDPTVTVVKNFLLTPDKLDKYPPAVAATYEEQITPRTYPLSRVMHILDFADRLDSKPENLENPGWYLWGEPDDD